MIPSSIKGPAVDAFATVIERLGSPDAGFDLRLLAPVWLDRPEGEFIDEAILQHVAWGIDIDILGLDYNQKVARIKGAIALHRRRGTKWAIRKELEVLGFVAVSIQEGNVSDLVHDGSVMHNGAYPHGGVRADWAVFSVNMLGVKGFDARQVLPAIERSKNARAKLIKLAVSIRCSIALTDDISLVVAKCSDGDYFATFVRDGYQFIVDVSSFYSEKAILGFIALDEASDPCGSVFFAAPVMRGSYDVRIIVLTDRNLGTSAAFDDSSAAFDDPEIQFND